MLNRWRIDPITRRRLRRFRRIRRGYLSFLVLLTLTGLSLVSNYIANRRAIVVSYQGELYFPTFRFYDMATFGQQDEYGFVLAKEGDAEGRVGLAMWWRKRRRRGLEEGTRREDVRACGGTSPPSDCRRIWSGWTSTRLSQPASALSNSSPTGPLLGER